ncbi:MAG: glycosyltransferase family 2 protein [Deltaproteobacteria bacterium]|nr:glycosyltransferase family 2 protein [Deltaproteobacteria bacterium]
MIEILMTATKRPEIIERTLRSFKANLFRNIPTKVIVNIDPVGPGTTKDVLDVIGEYFRVKSVNLPEVPHFGKAFKWVWSQAEADLCFWLEDDWELIRPLSLLDMMEVMFETPDLASLRLNWKPTKQWAMKNWKFYFLWVQVNKSGFFECPRNVRKCAQWVDANLNPEKQFHNGNEKLIREVLKWRYGVYGGQNQPPSVRDIGREWMISHGYRKKANKAWFTQWEEVA